MKFTGMTNKTARRRAQANLFHTCIHLLVAPINSIGETGIEMMSSDWIWRRCHPIFAAFVGDYLEQTLVTCVYSGCCPKCHAPKEQLGDYNQFSPRDFNKAIDILYISWLMVTVTYSMPLVMKLDSSLCTIHSGTPFPSWTFIFRSLPTSFTRCFREL